MSRSRGSTGRVLLTNYISVQRIHRFVVILPFVEMMDGMLLFWDNGTYGPI